MKIERFNMQGLVTDNARWVELVPNPEGSLCFYDQVPELEAKCAELEAKCAELETKCAELLDALESLVANVYSCACTMPTKEEREAWDKADAAIAKAKGEQP